MLLLAYGYARDAKDKDESNESEIKKGELQ